MIDIVLLTVNWNQQPCVELLLKSYVKYHYTGEPLKLMLFDNGSLDESKEWLLANHIPFFNGAENIGHENALNALYEEATAKYILLTDTDVEFKDNVYGYLDSLNDKCISAGELIDKNFINSTKIVDRISPWFWLWDNHATKKAGIEKFRTKQDWTYDVGSEFWEQMKNHGFENYHIQRHPGNQDEDIVSMRYDKLDHIGKVSWDIWGKHLDRITEVTKRREYVVQRLKEYQGIDLANKFVYG